MGQMSPFQVGRGPVLKRQLAGAAIKAMEAIRSIDASARLLCAEPSIHVVSHHEPETAESFRLSQYEAYDIISGRLYPELGGKEEYLDLVGANFYCANQWYLNGNTIPMGHHDYRPFRYMLEDLYRRYRRSVLVSETGAEGAARPYWLNHVAGEVRAAIAAGVPVGGLCLYPVLDYPGWANDRNCETGLFSAPDCYGNRELCEAFAAEVARQQLHFHSGPRSSSIAQLENFDDC
jgi:hypothetical protein